MVTTPADNQIAKPDCKAAPAAETSRDQMLVDLRSGRRLDRIVASIQNFLEMQVSRVEDTIAQCEAAVENDIRVQERMAKFEKEKREWDESRKQEIARLSQASDELAKAWEKLETERRQFVDLKTSK